MNHLASVPAKMKSHRLILWIALGVLVAACVGVGLPSNGAAGEGDQVWQEAPGDASPALPRGYSPLPSLKNLIKKLRPAVVNIYTTQVIKPRTRQRRAPRFRDPSFDEFFGGRDPFEFFFRAPPDQEIRRQSLGSGFIISSEGYLVTNHHVVENATEIQVKLTDEREFEAKVVGSDKKTDVALLKVSPKGKLPFVQLGDSDKLEVGDWAIAIGNPFGLGHTVTAGIISAKDRQIGHGPYDDFLQTDAAINFGNSGGPLFDAAGRVVGINTAIVAHGSGIGFAVPINLAKSLLPQLRTAGKVTRGWLGVTIQNLDRDLAEKFGVAPKSGVLVAQVFEDGPADRAGVRPGDIILSLDGKQMGDIRQLTNHIAGIAPKSSVRVEVLRDGKKRTLQAKLGERERGEALALGNGEVEEGQAGEREADLGMRLAPLTPERARRLGVNRDLRGLVVVGVDRSGPTQGIIRRGDVILEVNRRRVSSLRDFRRAVGSGKKGGVLLRIQRNNSQLYVVIER